MRPAHKQTFLWGFGAGIAYGLAAFFGFREANLLTTTAFLFGVPAGMSAVALLFTDDDQITNYRRVLLIPWLSILGLLVLSTVLFNEGVVCLIVLGLPFIGVALVATFVIWLVRARRIRAEKKRRAGLTSVFLLPLLLAPVEHRFFVTEEAGAVENAVVVEASAEAVWAHLAAVPTIGEAEYAPGFFHRLGIPRPIRATVDRAALGGRRTGEFTDGLRFDEVITEYDAPRRMTFSIAVDPTRLREGSAERHAFEIGYFRFVDATYTLEPLGEDRARLALASRFVLRSGVNAYGRLWADAVVGDFQARVLAVIARRAERADRPPSPAVTAAR